VPVALHRRKEYNRLRSAARRQRLKLAGGCPECDRPIAEEQRLCAHCFARYSRKLKGSKMNAGHVDWQGMVGQLFGSWRVAAVSAEKPKPRLGTMLECVCTCGRKRLMRGTIIRNGYSTMCSKCAERTAPIDPFGGIRRKR